MSGDSGTSPSSPTDTIARKGGSGHTGLYVGVAVVVVVVLLVAVAYSAGWFKGSNNGTSSNGCTLPSSQPLTGAGSTLVAPLMLDWAAKYTQSSVSYGSIGSGGGISDITQKTVDFGASDAPLNPTQRAAIQSPGVVTIPESAGAAVPIYNLPSVGSTLHFTGQVLAAIYLGAITNWNDTAIQALNPGVTLPNASIIVVFRSEGSGTTFVWTSFLSAANATWKNTIGHSTSIVFPVGTGSKGNSGVTTTVKSTVDAIGYVDINYALTNGIAFGAVQNPSGKFILANISNIASAIADSNVVLPAATGDWYNVTVLNAPGAGDYPIATLTYLFVYSDLGTAYGSAYTQAKAENLVDFLEWIVTKGQSAAPGLYYIPLSSAVVTSDLATIGALTYNGAAISVCVPTTSAT